MIRYILIASLAWTSLFGVSPQTIENIEKTNAMGATAREWLEKNGQKVDQEKNSPVVDNSQLKAELEKAKALTQGFDLFVPEDTPSETAAQPTDSKVYDRLLSLEKPAPKEAKSLSFDQKPAHQSNTALKPVNTLNTKAFPGLSTVNQQIWMDLDTKRTWQYHVRKDTFTWKDAERYCRDLFLYGHSDWRVPTKEELATLLEKSKTGHSYIKAPLLKSVEDLKGGTFWSASPFKNTDMLFSVDFASRQYEVEKPSNRNYVRCVR